MSLIVTSLALAFFPDLIFHFLFPGVIPSGNDIFHTLYAAISRSACDALLEYPWPGNIRECKNVVERSVYRSDSSMIDHIVFNPFSSEEHIPVKESSVEDKTAVCSGRSDQVDLSVPLEKAKTDLEKRYLHASLIKAHYNQKKAASLLGLTYDQFRRLYRKYGPAWG